MTTLSPSGGFGRRRSSGALPVVLAVIAALAVGLGAGWWFAGRSSSTPPAVAASSSPTCHSGTASPSGSASKTASTSTTKSSSKSPSGSPATTKKPSAKPPAALPLPSAITVNVYNATTRKGLAKTTSGELAARGFHTGKVTNDPSKKIIAAAAEIRYGPAGAEAAKVVAAQVIGAVLVPDNRKDGSVDFVLGEGYAALATPAQASAAIAALGTPSASPSGC
jgi:cytoskeletal protein RodZ